MAWFNAIVIVLVLTLSGGTVAILAFTIGMPKALGGLGFLGFSGILGLSRVLFRKKQDQIDFDERDQLIHMRAILGTYSIFWLVFTSACMIPFFILGPKASISVSWLPMMLVGIGFTLTLIHSVLILIQYGWKEKNYE